RRIEFDNAREEIQIRIENLRAELEHERRTALQKAVHSAIAAGIPHVRIKQVLNVSDDRTYKRHWVDGYVPPAKPEMDDGTGDYWFEVQPGTADNPARVHLTRLMDWAVDVFYVPDDTGLRALSELPPAVRGA